MQATVMVVTVTASTTSGQPLSEESLGKVLGACEVALALDEDKAAILRLVQLKMHHIAPNLSAAVGTEIAAKLMGVAGGLVNLSKMPACNVQARPSPDSGPHLCEHAVHLSSDFQ
jgi:U4/U6 small nuclear ribonucleoprotein PRP31